MEIAQSLINLGAFYFSPLTTAFHRWTKGDALKVLSFFSIVIPIFVGFATFFGYVGRPLTNRTKKDFPEKVKTTSDKVSKASQFQSKTTGVLGTAKVFLGKEGESQHSPQYQRVIGKKTNANKSKEDVFFATAACTPLAISFAATAKEANKQKKQANENTATAHLNKFLGNEEIVQRGITALNHLMAEPGSHVTLDAMNLSVHHGLIVYNAMMQTNLAEKRHFTGNENNYYSSAANAMFNEKNWFTTVLKKLNKGEGAVVILGGYSIGVRKVEDTFEIFDSHNSNSYTGSQGACVIQCTTKTELEYCIEAIRKAGSASSGLGAEQAAQGVEIYVF